MDLRELQKAYLDKVREVTEEKIETGALIITELSEEDGLVFKNGRKNKPKRLVIIGTDKLRQLCYGSVLVNTNMNPQADYSAEYLSAQYLLRQETYPEFLIYDSFVDCGELFSIPIAKLLKGEYYGKLTSDDQTQIFDILETTDTLSTKEKKRYGIKRR